MSNPPRSAESRKLSDVVREFTDDHLVSPSWQRDFCWPQKQQEDFIEFCTGYTHLPTPIHLVMIGNEKATEFILDGVQRLTTMSRHADPEWLKERQITVCYHAAETHDEAVQLFQKINNNTALHPYDLYRPELTLTGLNDFYERIWRRYQQELLRFSNLRRMNGAKREKQIRRKMLCLFASHLDKKRRASFKGIHRGLKVAKASDSIERTVSELLHAVSKSEHPREERKFIGWVQNCCAVIHEETVVSNKKTIALVAMESLLAINLHIRELGHSQSDWISLVRWWAGLVSERSLYSSRFEVDGKEYRLESQAALAVFEDGRLIKKKEPRPTVPLKPGYDNGHPADKPYSTHGNEGAVAAEPAMVNRSRGNG